MVQLYMKEQVFASHADMEYVRDVFIQECDSYQICKMLMEGLEKSREVKTDEVLQNKDRLVK